MLNYDQWISEVTQHGGVSKQTTWSEVSKAFAGMQHGQGWVVSE